MQTDNGSHGRVNKAIVFPMSCCLGTAERDTVSFSSMPRLMLQTRPVREITRKLMWDCPEMKDLPSICGYFNGEQWMKMVVNRRIWGVHPICKQPKLFLAEGPHWHRKCKAAAQFSEWRSKEAPHKMCLKPRRNIHEDKPGLVYDKVDRLITLAIPS